MIARDIAMDQVKQAVVVVAHPRSGTHLTMDFIRRNFPCFDPGLRPWQSAGELYVDLDKPLWMHTLDRPACRSDHVLLQSHRAGLCNRVGAQAIDRLRPLATLFVYPFRRFPATMRSFSDLRGYDGPTTRLLSETDRFFGLDQTVQACARQHGESWLGCNATFLDVDALIAEPERGAESLAGALGLPAAPLARRLPRRKRFHGKLAEAVQRLTGRESTEVKVHRRTPAPDPGEARFIDEAFADIYDEMTARSLNGAPSSMFEGAGAESRSQGRAS